MTASIVTSCGRGSTWPGSARSATATITASMRLVARELERAFGHERVQGAHIEREGRARPKRTPSHAEMQQGARTGITPEAARAHITNLWRQSDTGAAFAKALEDSGWILARGDRRDFVAVDPKGGVHSLARRIEGAKVRDVRARLVDLDLSALPSVAEARAMQRARQRARVRRRRRGCSRQHRGGDRHRDRHGSSHRPCAAPWQRRLARLARRPAALPIPRSAAPAHVAGGEARPAQAAGGLFTAASTGSHGSPRAGPERGGDPRTDSPRALDHPRALDWRNQSRALVARSPPATLPTAKPSKSKPVKVRKRRTHFRRVATSTVADRGLWPRHRSGSQGEGRAALDRADASARDRRHVLRAAHGLAGRHCRQDHMGGV